MVVFSIVKSVFGVVAPGTSSEFTPEKQLLEDEISCRVSAFLFKGELLVSGIFYWSCC